jgi:hypothetical protein
MTRGQMCPGRRERTYRTVFAVSVMNPSVPFHWPRWKKADTHGSHQAQDLFTHMPYML